MAIGQTKLPATLSRWKQPLEGQIDERLANIRPESLCDAIRTACSGGKRIRPLISLWFGSGLGVDSKVCLGMACLTEWLHNAFLIHDDIQDGDAWRRDVPSLWKSHGTATALNAADWLLSAVYSEISVAPVKDNVRSRLIAAVSEVHQRTVQGQQLDLSGRADPHFSLEDYEHLVKSKTGRYLALGMVCVAIVHGLEEVSIEQLWQVGDHLGPAFQIQDDLLDLTPDKGRCGESGNDIREGKPSILFAHSIQSHEITVAERQRVIEIMSLPREETTEAHVSECVELFQRAGSLEFARGQARLRSETGRDIFRTISGLSAEVQDEFESICNFMTDRNR